MNPKEVKKECEKNFQKRITPKFIANAVLIIGEASLFNLKLTKEIPLTLQEISWEVEDIKRESPEYQDEFIKGSWTWIINDNKMIPYCYECGSRRTRINSVNSARECYHCSKPQNYKGLYGNDVGFNGIKCPYELKQNNKERTLEFNRLTNEGTHLYWCHSCNRKYLIDSNFKKNKIITECDYQV